MDCVFCRLIRDDTATWIARGLSTCAFAPLTPIAPGHTLVVPTAHVTDVFDAAPHVLAQSMDRHPDFTAADSPSTSH